ncbi:hypothetical protein FCH33_06980 [Serratia fonticola]|nr:hypothetical protein [Serratia fonticola]NTZ12399.1 hypothetical protein [Serratia fonticola]
MLTSQYLNLWGAVHIPLITIPTSRRSACHVCLFLWGGYSGKPPPTTNLHAPLPTSKIIWGHNRGHQPKYNTIKLSKFNSTSYQMRLL